jgi:hypothetical protein
VHGDYHPGQVHVPADGFFRNNVHGLDRDAWTAHAALALLRRAFKRFERTSSEVGPPAIVELSRTLASR